MLPIFSRHFCQFIFTSHLSRYLWVVLWFKSCSLMLELICFSIRQVYIHIYPSVLTVFLLKMFLFSYLKMWNFCSITSVRTEGKRKIHVFRVSGATQLQEKQKEEVGLLKVCCISQSSGALRGNSLSSIHKTLTFSIRFELETPSGEGISDKREVSATSGGRVMLARLPGYAARGILPLWISVFSLK